MIYKVHRALKGGRERVRNELALPNPDGFVLFFSYPDFLEGPISFLTGGLNPVLPVIPLY